MAIPARIRSAILVLLLLAMALLPACRAGSKTGAGPAAAPVPKTYRQVCATLEAALDKFGKSLNGKKPVEGFQVTFGTELLVANANRGPDLLKPGALQGVSVFLDEFQEMGIGGVTIAVSYPLYSPDFPQYEEYVAFYKQVAREVRQRGMKLDVEAGVVFANTPFSPFEDSFTGLTFEQFKTVKKRMFQAIIHDLQPDYLNIGAEPDTAADLTGIRELLDPQKYREYVDYVLDGLDRGNTKVIAGIGSWGNLAYVRALAQTDLDAIDIHIYPVVGNCLTNAVAIAEIAAQNGKGVMLDECWLYKVDRLTASGVATAPEAFKRDSYSFWEPLDKQFLTEMAQFARAYRVEYVSPFWSNFFFATLEYDPAYEELSYTEVVALANQVATINVVNGKLSPLGEHYQRVIAENTAGE